MVYMTKFLSLSPTPHLTGVLVGYTVGLAVGWLISSDSPHRVAILCAVLGLAIAADELVDD